MKMQAVIDLNGIKAPLGSTQIGVDDRNKVRLEIFAEEVIEKIVKHSGNSGRVYLPPTWVGHTVKIVRVV
jgi:putative transposon-encoded protein